MKTEPIKLLGIKCHYQNLMIIIIISAVNMALYIRKTVKLMNGNIII